MGRRQPAGRQLRVLITGGAGFVGSHLCEALLRDGARVGCVDNVVTGSVTNVNHLLDDGSFALLRHDVTAPDFPSIVDRMVERGRIDVVFHLASPASPVDYLRLPLETLMAGSVGTLHALELARRSGARFVLASTSEVYGDPLRHPQREDYWGNVNPVGPRAVYDEAKRFAEALTCTYRGRYGVDTGIARIFNTYGPRMRSADGRMIPTFIRQALAGEPLTVHGDGLQTRSICYVDDTVRGLVALARSDMAGPVNIGGTDEMTVLRLAHLVRDLTGSPSEIVHTGRPVDDPTVRRPDTTLAHEALGWSTRVSALDGLRRTLQWWRTLEVA